MKRVLVVNNNLEFIEALAEGLTLKSYQVISCNKPQSLLAKIQKCTPDLIILDSETTDINTTALLNELFQYDPKIPSIVLWKAEEGKQKPEFENTPFVTSFVEKDGDIGKIIRNVQKLLPQFRFTDKFLIGDYHSAVGQTLGNCVLKRMLGSGGTGIVYLADHKVTKNPVAVKVLSPSLYNEPAAIMRFIREASVLASIDHPNIVKILDTDKQDGIYYLVMEYIHGTSLLELLKKKGKLPYQRATHIIRQAGSGLWAAHKKMILHRDLKPSNILISNEDHKVKIIDFGLARQVSCEEEITKEGIIIGTPGYIPPEQCLNQQLNESSDIYSLGVTFYKTVTGQEPFSGSSVSKLLAQLKGNFIPASQVEPSVPEELSNIISKMLAKKREYRYNSIAYVLEDLDKFLGKNNKKTWN